MYINTTLWFSSCNKVRAAVREDESTRSRTLDSFLTAPSVWCVSLSLSLGLDSGHDTQRGEVWIALQRRSSRHQDDERGYEFSRSVSLRGFPPTLCFFLSVPRSRTPWAVVKLSGLRAGGLWVMRGDDRRDVWRERERAWCRMKVFQLTGSVSDLWPEVYSLSLDAVSRSFSLPLSFVAVLLLTSSCFFIQLSSCLSLACTLLHSFTPTQNF